MEKSQVIFIAVGTPPAFDGSADLHFVLDVAKEIGKYINGYKVIVDKSTVPVGTGKLVKETIQKELSERKVDYEFDIISNPEFLREGKAVTDCQRPDRIVIGYESEKAKDIMKKVYDVLFINETPFLFTNIETAEMIKYASNAFLAVKISFINEIALLSEKVGSNAQEIAGRRKCLLYFLMDLLYVSRILGYFFKNHSSLKLSRAIIIVMGFQIFAMGIKDAIHYENGMLNVYLFGNWSCYWRDS